MTEPHPSLPAEPAHLLRLLKAHPGPELSLGALSAAAGLSPPRARQSADILATTGLLKQTAPGRYQLPTPPQTFTTEEAPPEPGRAALRRVLDWYLHTAAAAQTWIRPAEEHVVLEPPEDVTPLSFPDYDRAVDWSEQEHSNFLPCVLAAADAGLDRHTWQLALVFWNAQAPSAPVAAFPAMAEKGLGAARRLGDRTAEFGLLETLGLAYKRVNRLTESLDCHRAALSLCRRTGDRHGEAASLNLIGLIHLRRRELDEAERHLGQSLSLYQELDAPHWTAIVLANLATTHYRAGHLTEAADRAQQALTTHRTNEDQPGIGNALRTLSAVHLERGELAEALQAAEQAVDLALDLRDHVLEGYWLLALGDAQLALSHPGDALASYQRSATLHRRLGDRSREALAWDGTGRAYHQLGSDEEAAAFHRQAAAAHRELRDAWNQALALVGLAAALEQTDPDRARQHRSEALDLLGEHDDPRAERLRRSIGDCCG